MNAIPDASPAAATPADRSRIGRRFRYGTLLVLLLAAGGAGAWIWLASNLEGATRTIASAVLVAVVILLFLLWLAFLSGARLRVALAAVGIILLGDLAFLGLIRVEGLSGNLVPILAWRWSRPTEFKPPTPPGSGNVGAALADLTETTPADYPQFLGPDRQAIVRGLELHRDWKTRPPRLVWRQPIGKGWSAFAVVGPYAVTQEQRGSEEMVVCYEVATGRLIWSHADQVTFESVVAGDGPRATPTIADGRVYAFGATGSLTCLDGADGSARWQRNVLADNNATSPTWGKSCSPLVIDDIVVVSAGGSEGHSLVAYDKASGQPVWHGGDDLSGYSSPTRATLCGVPQILILNAASVAAHDPADGRVLWESPWGGADPNVSQPVAVGDDRVFVSSGYGQGCTLLRIERSEDGAFRATPLWKELHMKTKFNNVVLREGYVYGLDDPGILECVELASGKRLWKRGRYGHGQILLVGDLLIVQAESGEVALVEATPEGMKELGRLSVFDRKTWNNPVVAGKYLLVRNDEEAACFELALEEPPHG